MAGAKITYAADLRDADRRSATLGIGQRRRLWTYWGVHDGHHVLELHDSNGNPTGTEQYLTNDQVDRLLFDYFADEKNWGTDS